MNLQDFNKQPHSLKRFFKLCPTCNNYFDLRNLKDVITHQMHGEIEDSMKNDASCNCNTHKPPQPWTKYEEPPCWN